MIVGHCIHGLGLGGAQKVIEAIARGGTPGFQHIVYSCEDGVLTEPVRSAGAQVRIVPRRLPKFDPFWISDLAGWMREDRVDVVHTHLFGDTLHGLLAAGRVGLPGLATLHTVPDGLSGIQRVGYRWLLPRAHRTIACSRSVAEAFEAEEPEIAKRVVTIPNGVDLPLREYAPEEVGPARAALGLPADGVVLACLGRLHPQKAFDRVIKAFGQLETGPAGPSLLIVGDGPLRTELEAQAARVGASDRIVFTGARSDVGDLLPLIDVLVFASPYEGLPMALLEAMSAGRCVVAADIEALRDVLISEEEALLVPENELVAGLQRVVSDDAMRAALGRGAKRKHGLEFSAARMVADYEALYREAVESAPTSGPSRR